MKEIKIDMRNCSKLYFGECVRFCKLFEAWCKEKNVAPTNVSLLSFLALKNLLNVKQLKEMLYEKDD